MPLLPRNVWRFVLDFTDADLCDDVNGNCSTRSIKLTFFCTSPKAFKQNFRIRQSVFRRWFSIFHNEKTDISQCLPQFIKFDGISLKLQQRRHFISFYEGLPKCGNLKRFAVRLECPSFLLEIRKFTTSGLISDVLPVGHPTVAERGARWLLAGLAKSARVGARGECRLRLGLVALEPVKKTIPNLGPTNFRDRFCPYLTCMQRNLRRVFVTLQPKLTSAFDKIW